MPAVTGINCTIKTYPANPILFYSAGLCELNTKLLFLCMGAFGMATLTANILLYQKPEPNGGQTK